MAHNGACPKRLKRTRHANSSHRVQSLGELWLHATQAKLSAGINLPARLLSIMTVRAHTNYSDLIL